jgi:CRISPR system Cascade subunit CasE
MYLTRFEINPARRDARSLLASPQRLHAAVLAAFPDDAGDHDDGRVLWRLDESRHDLLLYLVSPAKPDLTHLAETVGRPTYGWDTRDYSPLLDRLTAGDRWAFRLLANPVRSGRKTATSTHTQRFAHVTATQQIDWFLRQAERHGFTVPDNSLGEPDLAARARRTMRFTRQQQTLTLSTALFEGHLHVEDPAALRAALISGIGPAKAYGCGLLTLAPEQ